MVAENPYAPPSADCFAPAPSDLFGALKSQSTWRLCVLGLLTCGIYFAHYCARQSKIINRYAGKAAIPTGLVIAILVVSYLSIALLVGYLLVDEGHPVAIASNVIDKLWMFLVLLWGFYARNVVNAVAVFTPDNPRWISGLWTFLFSPMYFNYKVNVIHAMPDTPQTAAEVSAPHNAL